MLDSAMLLRDCGPPWAQPDPAFRGTGSKGHRPSSTPGGASPEPDSKPLRATADDLTESWGDPEQLIVELAARFRGRILAVAVRLQVDGPAADDVVQETLQRVLVALRAGKVTSPEVLPAYVFAVVRNICLNHQRGSAREWRALSQVAAETVREETAPAPSVLDRLISDERRAGLREALERLEAPDRELLRLYYGEGLESAEIARRLGLKPGALRVRKHRALQRLGALVAGPGPSNAGGGSAI